MTQKSPLAGLFPMARWVAAGPENAPVNSPASANGMASQSFTPFLVRVSTCCFFLLTFSAGTSRADSSAIAAGALKRLFCSYFWHFENSFSHNAGRNTFGDFAIESRTLEMISASIAAEQMKLPAKLTMNGEDRAIDVAD